MAYATLDKMVTVFINSICSFINNFIVWCIIPNFCYHGNTGLSEENFKDTVKLADPENPQSGTIICDITVTHANL